MIAILTEDSLHAQAPSPRQLAKTRLDAATWLTMASSRLTLCLLIAIAAGSLVPATAQAQFRYLTFGELRERFTNRVFGTETAQARWDVISELEPGFRLFYGQGHHRVELSYHLMLQLFARTPNADNSGPLIGYGNYADLNYGLAVGPRTVWLIADQVAQGTENTVFPITLSETGVVSPARLTLGSRYVSDSFLTGISHVFNNAWALAMQAIGDYARSSRTEVTGEQLPPSYSAGGMLDTRLDWSFGAHVLFFTQTDRIAFSKEKVFPHPLATLVVGAGIGWRWLLTHTWSSEISTGGQYTIEEQWLSDPNAGGPVSSKLRPSISPLARVLLMYDDLRHMRFALSYGHLWARQRDPELASLAETDEAGLFWLYALRHWHFEADASFTYVRNSTMVAGLDPIPATKAVVGEAVVTYVVNPYLSLEVGYRAQAVFGQRQTLSILATDYVAHYVTAGLSVIWPAPVGTDLTRVQRVTESRPLFQRSMGGGGGGAATGDPNALFFEPPGEAFRRQSTFGNEELEPREPEPHEPGPETEVPPLDQPEQDQDRERDEEQEPGYFSWPR